MFKAMKFLIFVAAILVAAFFANHLGYVSIPWLDVNSVVGRQFRAYLQWQCCPVGRCCQASV